MNKIKLNYNNDTNSKLAKFLALARRKRIIALTQRNVKLQQYIILKNVAFFATQCDTLILLKCMS